MCRLHGPDPVNPVTSPPTSSPVETAIPVGNIVVDEQQNGATTSLDLNRTITLRLKENPSAGYVWDLTVTPGLKVTNDTFYPSDTSGSMVGAGGTREWTITTLQPGEQKVKAIYKHPWEPCQWQRNHVQPDHHGRPSLVFASLPESGNETPPLRFGRAPGSAERTPRAGVRSWIRFSSQWGYRSCSHSPQSGGGMVSMTGGVISSKGACFTRKINSTKTPQHFPIFSCP